MTLSAVGAHPALRRNVAFWQAVLMTGTGTGAGLGGFLGLLGPPCSGWSVFCLLHRRGLRSPCSFWGYP